MWILAKYHNRIHNTPEAKQYPLVTLLFLSSLIYKAIPEGKKDKILMKIKITVCPEILVGIFCFWFLRNIKW